MPAATGGFTITAAEWQGLTALAVDVESLFTDRYFQLYAGRRLIGVTSAPGQTRVVGQLQPAHCPHSITVVMCEEGEQNTDFGAQLARRPFNQFQMAWQADSFPADAKWFELTAATAAGGVVDTETIIARVAYQGDGDYSFIFPPVDEPGEWAARITPRDDAIPTGNGDNYSEITVDVLPYPPDVLVQDDDTRLTTDVTDGILTVGFEYDWDA